MIIRLKIRAAHRVKRFRMDRDLYAWNEGGLINVYKVRFPAEGTALEGRVISFLMGSSGSRLVRWYDARLNAVCPSCFNSHRLLRGERVWRCIVPHCEGSKQVQPNDLLAVGSVIRYQGASRVGVSFRELPALLRLAELNFANRKGKAFLFSLERQSRGQ